jgi:hypothetical protein
LKEEGGEEFMDRNLKEEQFSRNENEVTLIMFLLIGSSNPNRSMPLNALILPAV